MKPSFLTTHIIYRKGTCPRHVQLLASCDAPMRNELKEFSLFRFTKSGWRYRSGAPVDGVIQRYSVNAGILEAIVKSAC